MGHGIGFEFGFWFFFFWAGEGGPDWVGLVWFPGPGFLPFLSRLRWVWVRVRFSIYSISIYSLFPNLIQTKFEFKIKI